MKKMGFALLWAAIIGLAWVGMTSAQSESLALNLSRDWGYGGLNGDIQGLFSMDIKGLADVARVEFYIDDTKIGELDKAPYNFQFNTDNYPLGIHRMYAIGYSTGGQVYQSNVISANFVPKQDTLKFVLPILAVVLLAVLLSALVPVLISWRKGPATPMGTERNYGLNGGAICPKCHRPFVLPMLGMHVGLSKLTICPYCGKWSVVRRESIERLRQAEKDELAEAQSSGQISGQTEEEARKELDDSKYQDE